MRYHPLSTPGQTYSREQCLNAAEKADLHALRVHDTWSRAYWTNVARTWREEAGK